MRRGGYKMRGKQLPGEIIGRLKGAVSFIFLISAVVNILALTGAIYMLQIYDRALTSQSLPTLAALTLLALTLYLFQGLLDMTRTQILVRLGARLDESLSPLTHKVVIDMPRFGHSLAEARERGRDVDIVRNFLSTQGPQALFDLPFMPLYIAFIYLLHPWLGLLAIGGALLLAGLTLLTEIVTRKRSFAVSRAELSRAKLAETQLQNSDVIHAMGFAGRSVARYELTNDAHLKLQTGINDLTSSFASLSKVFRMILQSAVLGLGAYLTIKGELSAGAIIAASVASARALAPVDLAISQWKSLRAARRSYKRISETITALKTDKDTLKLPPPEHSLRVEAITIAAPLTGSVLIKDMSLELKAGQALGVIGHTGSGKSTLARALTGVWPLLKGHIRLDGADLSQWQPDELGKHIGYLPQETSLLDGSIAENICRFDPSPNSEKIIIAAKAAGIHDMVVTFKNGYQTELGSEGTSLSGGQRQRIGLARALYDDPFLLVLDEPNSNLDHAGDLALIKAISSVKARGGICVVITHRPSALAACETIAIMKAGQLARLAPKDQIFHGGSGKKAGQSNLQPEKALATSEA